MEIILKYFTDFSSEQLDKLQQLQDLYRYWNERINVISRKDIDALYEKHVLHSLSIAAANPFKDNQKVIDIGTGGGFPGIPLAIYYPKVRFVLVDSIGKKTKVVQEIAQSIDLKNIQVIHGRAEEMKEKDFNFAVSRAVAPLSTLWKWAKPLIKKEGNNGLICLKGGNLAEEIALSNLRPINVPITQFFKEVFFEDKYLLWVKK